ncbi:hypothetical protein ANCCAN_16325 [Ancylostoma caninum]|uniref:Uncharacterized protein n=1 Tax=Ancylostoma caninum TaxID=29170 RepID=A0A368G237_ANCCA|nr:hypothetical protein ANCCAN_16325 [Ancylostoma caninum]
MALPLDLPVENSEVSFTEKKFLPFSESNQVLIIYDSGKGVNTTVHTCLINAYGRLQFVEENKMVCLPKLLNESSLKSGHSIELSCSDVSPLNSDRSLAILATCWVELNEHFCPCRHFGAVFRISSTLHVELTSKVEAATPVAHCSIITRMEDSKLHKYWIVYGVGEELPIYKMQEGSGQANKIDNALSVFPELALDVFPGAVTRSSLVRSEKLRWSALGFDTGHVFLSVFSLHTHMVYRKLIKFSGPISVVYFIPSRVQNTPILCDKDDSGPVNFHEERYLVVSSTLGPVAVWKCNFEEDFLSWNHEFVLKQSEQFDTITSACAIRDLIAVGTYSGKVLFYSSNCDLLSHEIASITQIHAPVVTMKVLDETTLYVLSTAGLHTVTLNDV